MQIIHLNEMSVASIFYFPKYKCYPEERDSLKKQNKLRSPTCESCLEGWRGCT